MYINSLSEIYDRHNYYYYLKLLIVILETGTLAHHPFPTQCNFGKCSTHFPANPKTCNTERVQKTVFLLNQLIFLKGFHFCSPHCIITKILFEIETIHWSWLTKFTTNTIKRLQYSLVINPHTLIRTNSQIFSRQTTIYSISFLQHFLNFSASFANKIYRRPQSSYSSDLCFPRWS